MKALQHFFLLGAACFAVSRWLPWTFALPNTQHSGATGNDVREEGALLGAAIARRLGDDDIVVQRRLVQTARALGLASDADVYRAAMKLDLGEGDPIIERRLVQQMRLELEDEARRAEPTEAELRQYLIDHADHFVLPERVRVTHLFFSVARRGEHTERDARAVLDTLSRAGNGHALGDPSLWPATLPLQTAGELEKVFGAAAPDVAAAPPNFWTGPHWSALGYHLARVDERVPATVPAFATVRAAVRLALLNDRAEQHVQQTLAAVR